MAENDLTSEDVEFILTSLDYTRLNVESTSYPTYELRRERFDELDRVVAKVRAIRDCLREKHLDMPIIGCVK